MSREASKEVVDILKLRPETVAILEYFEKEIIQHRITPLQERLKKLEDRIDYLVSQIVSDVAKNVVSAAYELSTSEIRNVVAEEVRKAVAQELSEYSRMAGEFVAELGRAVKAIESTSSSIGQKLASIADLKVQIDAKKLATEIKPVIDEAIVEEVVAKIKGSTSEAESKLSILGKRIEELGMALDRISQRISALTDAVGKVITALEGWPGEAGEIEEQAQEYGEHEEETG